MRKYKPPPPIKRNDKRCGDEYLREWAKCVGSVKGAARLAGLYPTHLHVWFADPDRRFSIETMLKLSRTAKIPIEALMFRWTPIKELDMWKWLKP